MEMFTCLKAVFDGIPTSLAIIASAVIALLAIRTNRHIARQKNTLDFETNHLDQNLLDAYSTLAKLHNNKFTTPMTEWSKDAHFDTHEARSIRKVLNTWERVSRGIDHGIYDEKILYDTYRSTIRIVSNYTFDYRKEVQKKRSSYYAGFEKISSRWFIKDSQQN